MRTVLTILLLAASAGAASAQYEGSYGSNRSGGYRIGSNPNSHYVASGEYVQPHYRTNPNSTPLDNYGTSPNYNPHTGQTGNRNRW